MSRVLVTGATGFIGRGALEPLLARGDEVHAVSSGPAPEWSPDRVIWHRADLLDPTAAVRVISAARPHGLLHFAWYAEPGAFWTSMENLRWVEASLRLLRAFADAGGRRAVVAGTCAEYAWEDWTVCTEDATPLAPATLYGAAKHGLRTIAEAHAREAGYALAWGRIFLVFGPREDRRRLGGAVGAALAAREPARTSSGEQVRDVSYSLDVAEAFVAVLGSDLTGALNVAAGRPVAVRRLAEALGEAAGRPDLVELGALPPRPGDPAALTADVTRLRDEVGWRPRRTLDEAAAETMAWWEAQRAWVA
jgi:nucleoside-diphosphate-sugar epimerase